MLIRNRLKNRCCFSLARGKARSFAANNEINKRQDLLKTAARKAEEFKSFPLMECL